MTTRTPSGASMPTLYPGLDDAEQTPFEHPSDAERRTDWSDHPLWPRDEPQIDPSTRRFFEGVRNALVIGLAAWAALAVVWLAT